MEDIGEDQVQMQLSKNSRILYNLLQVRVFDLSQALQVQGHKLSINQVKQSLEKQYNIFGQIEKIYEELKINNLYDLMKQISQNYISICSILLDKKLLNKQETIKSSNQQSNEKNRQSTDTSKSSNNQKTLKQKFQKLDTTQRHSIYDVPITQLIHQNQIHQSIQQIVNTLNQYNNKKNVHNRLGGISLYNQNYNRGIQSLQKKNQAIICKKKKRYNQKQLIKQLIYKQITDQSQVEKLHENDEISKFIKQGKIKHQLYNHIEYEKDLESISLFLKQSQDDALKFLTDSKKNQIKRVN